MTTPAEADALRVKHKAAAAAVEANDTDKNYAAEQVAWDEFRDACETAYPHGVCPHDECPGDRP